MHLHLDEIQFQFQTPFPCCQKVKPSFPLERAQASVRVRPCGGPHPEDRGLRVPGHRQPGGLRGPLQQRALPVPQLRLQRHRRERLQVRLILIASPVLARLMKRNSVRRWLDYNFISVWQNAFLEVVTESSNRFAILARRKKKSFA